MHLLCLLKCSLILSVCLQTAHAASELSGRFAFNLQSDLSDFPNAGDVLQQGNMVVEWAPASFTGSSDLNPSMYSSNVLVRYGLLDRLEVGIYTEGVSIDWTKARHVGFSPLFFDTKIDLLEPDDVPGIESLAIQTLLQTNLLGTTEFDGGLEPIITLNADHVLPGDLHFEYNIGSMRYMNTCDPRRMDWNVTFTWSVKKKITEKLNIFIDGFYGSSAIPKVPGMVPVTMGQCAGVPSKLTYYGRVFGENVVGTGLEWEWTSSIGTYVNIAAGTNNSSPSIMSYMGFIWVPGNILE
jgi:subtilase-type serine protease